MLISEQGLCRAIKQIHKTGYDILMDESELVISSERFLVVMDRRDIPRKVQGLLVEHMGCLPDGGNGVKEIGKEETKHGYGN
ncbi:MAG: hypothetical protein LKK00_01720 [Intestinimonas sp.]|jgi:hypothetical protein|nr:hypothetical protein [Intestinimonas sp.]